MYVMHFRIWKVLCLVHSCTEDTSYFVRNLLAVRFASNKAFFPRGMHLQTPRIASTASNELDGSASQMP